MFGTPDLRDSHNSLGLPIVFESFSLKNDYFFVVINFEASYLAFLYNSLSLSLSLMFVSVFTVLASSGVYQLTFLFSITFKDIYSLLLLALDQFNSIRR